MTAHRRTVTTSPLDHFACAVGALALAIALLMLAQRAIPATAIAPTVAGSNNVTTDEQACLTQCLQNCAPRLLPVRPATLADVTCLRRALAGEPIVSCGGTP